MKHCPEKKDKCPCPEFSKDGLCDWPYRNGMTPQELKYMTELLETINKEVED
jgi:hypothetical protein